MDETAPSRSSLLDTPEISRPVNQCRPLDTPPDTPDSGATPTRVRELATARFRHNGWEHLRAAVLRSFDRTDQPYNRKTAFIGCGAECFILRSTDQPYAYRLAGSACHDRFCTPCARERSRIVTSNGLDLLQGKPVRFVTLTVRTTTETLKQALAKLDTAFSALRRRAFWKRHVTGGVAFTEVIWFPDTKRWHPHLHVLTHGRYIPKAALKAEWLHVTGDSTIIDIRLVTTAKGILNYVTKYCGKGLDTSYARDERLLDEAVQTLKGRRLLTAFGDFRGTKLTDPGDGETWEQIGSLWEYLQRARDGDQDALEVLAAIDTPATNYVVGWLRQRDPAPELPVPTITCAQLPLFGTFYWWV